MELKMPPKKKPQFEMSAEFRKSIPAPENQDLDHEIKGPSTWDMIKEHLKKGMAVNRGEEPLPGALGDMQKGMADIQQQFGGGTKSPEEIAQGAREEAAHQAQIEKTMEPAFNLGNAPRFHYENAQLGLGGAPDMEGSKRDAMLKALRGLMK
jgi:hypothetical protein